MLQVVDFSTAPDAYPTLYASMASWFFGQENPQAILDGRFAAEALRGTSCINSTLGLGLLNPPKLFVNYFVRESEGVT